MKRLFILVVLVCATIGSASAQKRDVVALTEEINALKAREEAMHKHIDSLNNEVNKLVRAYASLEEAYDNKSQKIDSLCVKFDRLIAATEALPQLNFEQSYGSLLAKIDTLTEALNNQATTVQSNFERWHDVQEGMAIVREGVLYGYVNNKNEYVIPAQFEGAYDFEEGLAAVKFNDKWGFIDKSGKVVIPMQFDEVKSFYNGIAGVKLNGKWGFINKIGKYVVNLQFDGVDRCGGGYWMAEKNMTDASYTYAVYQDGRVKFLNRTLRAEAEYC